MNIKALNDRVVVKAEKQAAVTSSGILLVDESAEKPIRGAVVSAGPATKSVAVGNQVLFSRHTAYTAVKLDGEELLVMREADLFAVIKE